MMSIYLLQNNAGGGNDLIENLRRRQYAVTQFSLSHELFYALRKSSPKLCIIDEALPDAEGLNVVAQLRLQYRSGLGIVLVTAAAEDGRTIEALRAGADDCMARACDAELLLARVESLLRRIDVSSGGGTAITHGPYCLDYPTQLVTVAGRTVALAPREFDLLWVLLSNPCRVLSKAELSAMIWGRDIDCGSQSLTQHVHWLRRKLDMEEHGYQIVSIYGVGYRLECNVQKKAAAATRSAGPRRIQKSSAAAAH